MQNKINQKVPIAKMDELIKAIKESGGGGGKLYRHNIFIRYPSVGTPSGIIYLNLYTSSNTKFNNDTLSTYLTHIGYAPATGVITSSDNNATDCYAIKYIPGSASGTGYVAYYNNSGNTYTTSVVINDLIIEDSVSEP